jgi:dTDP-4-dehydrorhamnose 3,5-epimerase-like enzyme
VSQFYSPLQSGAFAIMTPAFSIEWPLEVSVISEKDWSLG